jgi:type I restriction enzyme S subunit
VLRPEGWKRRTLADIADFRNGINFLRGERGYSVKVVGVGDFQRHETLAAFGDTSTITITNEIGPDDLLQDGDLLFVRSNGNKALVGRCALISGVNEPVTFSGFTIRARVKSSEVNHSYLSKLVRSPLFLAHLHRHGGGSSINNLSQEALAEFAFELPPLPEQRKIAAILRTWDEALERLAALRAAKARRLDGLRGRLIHDQEVKRLHLREFLRELSTRNRGQKVDRVLSVTNSAGFVLAEEQFAHRVASADLSNYKIVRRGQYAYNPSRINVGSIARLEAWDEGALSPMYVVFELAAGLESDFFWHWLRSGQARQRIALAAQGSVRETVSIAEFGSILIPFPDTERQKSIARALNAAQHELALLDAEIDALTRQKRGLMQKLLTGAWRVKPEEPVA